MCVCVCVLHACVLKRGHMYVVLMLFTTHIKIHTHMRANM